jgi:hypothetical protein
MHRRWHRVTAAESVRRRRGWLDAAAAEDTRGCIESRRGQAIGRPDYQILRGEGGSARQSLHAADRLRGNGIDRTCQRRPIGTGVNEEQDSSE